MHYTLSTNVGIDIIKVKGAGKKYSTTRYLVDINIGSVDVTLRSSVNFVLGEEPTLLVYTSSRKLNTCYKFVVKRKK